MNKNGISIAMINYLKNKKGYSIDGIAKSMGTSLEHIQDILNQKSFLKEEQILFYLKTTNTTFYNFIYESIDLKLLPKKTREKILFYKKLSERIKKKKKKT